MHILADNPKPYTNFNIKYKRTLFKHFKITLLFFLNYHHYDPLAANLES